MTGANQNGRTEIRISDGTGPATSEDPLSAHLARIPAAAEYSGNVNVSLPFSHTKMTVDLFPDYQAAIVYPDTGVWQNYELVNLAGLTNWRLRIASTATSSSGYTNSRATLRLRKVQVTGRPKSKIVLGFVARLPTGRPLAGASVVDELGTKVAETLDNGAFSFLAESWPARIRVQHEGFHPSQELEITGIGQRRPLRFELRKKVEGFGDVLEVIPYPRPSCIAWLGQELWALDHEYAGTNCYTLLGPVDLHGKTLLSPVWRFTLGDHPLASFLQCGDRMLATLVHPGGIYELDQSTRTCRLLAKPKTPDGRRIDWPWASAFDGQFLWLLESDGYANAFGLHAVDPETLQIKHSLSCQDTDLNGVAWDPKEEWLWISSLSGQVYSIDAKVAVREGRTAPALRRSFKGYYRALACDGNFLWGVDPEMQQICKIKIRE